LPRSGSNSCPAIKVAFSAFGCSGRSLSPSCCRAFDGQPNRALASRLGFPFGSGTNGREAQGFTFPLFLVGKTVAAALHGFRRPVWAHARCWAPVASDTIRNGGKHLHSVIPQRRPKDSVASRGNAERPVIFDSVTQGVSLAFDRDTNGAVFAGCSVSRRLRRAVFVVRGLE
jgi:hypothetical protein